jgi:N utilization substance protein B
MPTPDTKRTSSRHKARKRAVDIVYSADLLDTPIPDELARRLEAEPGSARPYTEELVTGVWTHLESIDAALATALESTRWTLDRLPTLDRAIARVAVYELLHTDLPTPVAIAEAVALAQEFSTDPSPAFLNGVLSRVATA